MILSVASPGIPVVELINALKTSSAPTINPIAVTHRPQTMRDWISKRAGPLMLRLYSLEIGRLIAAQRKASLPRKEIVAAL